MYEQEPITKAALIGLGAIGSYLASHLQTVLGDNLRIIAGGARKERLERDGVVVNGKRLHFHVVDPQEDCGGDYPQLAIIITDCGDAIAREIGTQIERGVTSVKAVGTYTGAPRQMLLCACSRAEAYRIRSIAYTQDRNALVTLCPFDAAYGLGFQEPPKEA